MNDHVPVSKKDEEQSEKKGVSVHAVIAFVLSLVGLTSVGFGKPLFAVATFIWGLYALSDVKHTNRKYGGVLAWAAVIFSVLTFLLPVAARWAVFSVQQMYN